MAYDKQNIECDSLIASSCGGKMTPTMLDNCDSMYFDGVDNVTINQGVGIDLSYSVTAYDSTGMEIPFEYEPTEIDKCSVGEHEVIYKAIGADERLLPSICGENFLSMACSGISTLIAKRLVTIEQADPPTINGIGATTLSVDEMFDPMSGVIGVDDNGNPVDVTYNGKYTNSAEGDIASFETDLTDPLRSLKVSLAPIQNLHGYDAPWVGGAGKNKIKITADTLANSQRSTSIITDSGITVTATGTYGRRMDVFTVEIGKTYTLSFKGESDGDFHCVYVQSAADWSNASVIARLYPETTEGSFSYTFTATTNVLALGWYVTASASSGYMTIKDLQLELGSTATTYEPYENICPISGHDDVTVTQTEKNLVDVSAVTSGLCGYHSGDTINSHISSMRHAYSDLLLAKDGLSAITKSSNLTDYDWCAFSCFNADGYWVATVSTSIDALNTAVTLSIPSNTYQYARIIFGAVGNTMGTNVKGEITCVKGTTAPTEFVPYNGQTYTTTLPSTTYGGTLDLVSGELVLTKAKKTFDGTEQWQKSSDKPASFFTYWSQFSTGAGKTHQPFICSYAKMADSFASYTLGECWSDSACSLYIQEDTNMTTAEFKSFLADKYNSGSPVQVCYELATPQTYQLTPQQIQTLLGQNNVWSEQGDVYVEFLKSIPQGEFSYPLDGVYTIDYHAEDECGNTTTQTRQIIVGDGS